MQDEVIPWALAQIQSLYKVDSLYLQLAPHALHHMDMKSLKIEFLGIVVDLKIEPGAIHFPITEKLKAVLESNLNANTTTMVKSIQDKYKDSFGKFLVVSDDSMAVEIWGHLYMEKFLKRVDNLIPFDFLKTLSEKLLERTSTVDIGEKDSDSNRFIWDMIAPYRANIAKLLTNK